MPVYSLHLCLTPIFAYYPLPFNLFIQDQKAFEAKVFKKTSGKADVDVLVIDGCTVLSRSSVDLYFYVIGSQVSFSHNQSVKTNHLKWQ